MYEKFEDLRGTEDSRERKAQTSINLTNDYPVSLFSLLCVPFALLRRHYFLLLSRAVSQD